MQVGLTDMLAEEYGIVPAGFLGHSAGEIACGYADGGLSREQVIGLGFRVTFRVTFRVIPDYADLAVLCSMSSPASPSIPGPGVM